MSTELSAATHFVDRIHEDKYALMQCLVNELAHCLYAMRINAQIQTDAGHYLASIEEDEPTDLAVGCQYCANEIHDLLIHQRNRLVTAINSCLEKLSSIQLQIDEEDPWYIHLVGDECGREFDISLMRKRDVMENSSNQLILVFPEADWGQMTQQKMLFEKAMELLKENKHCGGEFWGITGNVELAKVLWPFRIDLAGNCVCVEQVGNILICSNTEK